MDLKKMPQKPLTKSQEGFISFEIESVAFGKLLKGGGFFARRWPL
jgi:hypothetical protein